MNVQIQTKRAKRATAFCSPAHSVIVRSATQAKSTKVRRFSAKFRPTSSMLALTTSGQFRRQVARTVESQPGRATLIAGDTVNVENPVRVFGATRARSELVEQFKKHVEAWKAETSHWSNAAHRAEHRSYQAIIAMGALAIPLILGEMKDEPDDWFWALHELTKVNPVPPENRGFMQRMTKAWLKWGRDRGIVS